MEKVLISYWEWNEKAYQLIKSYPEFNKDSWNRYVEGIGDTLEDEILSQELIHRANCELDKAYIIE
jgi:hypothetical protein